MRVRRESKWGGVTVARNHRCFESGFSNGEDTVLQVQVVQGQRLLVVPLFRDRDDSGVSFELGPCEIFFREERGGG